MVGLVVGVPIKSILISFKPHDSSTGLSQLFVVNMTVTELAVWGIEISSGRLSSSPQPSLLSPQTEAGLNAVLPQWYTSLVNTVAPSTLTYHYLPDS